MWRAPHVEDHYDVVAASSMSTPRLPMIDHEGLIAVERDYYCVVDCDRLHIINGNDINVPRRQADPDPAFSTFFGRAYCPKCRQAITKSRQIAVTSDIPSPTLDPSSPKMRHGEVPWSFPSLPEVVPSPVQRISARTTPNTSKKKGLFSKWNPLPPSTKSQKSSKSVSSSDNTGTLPKHLTFCFSLSGKNLILWKKDNQSLVRIEVESRGSRLLDLTDMLPASEGVATVNIRFVAEGHDWISVLVNHNRQLILLVLHSSGLLEESSWHLINEKLDPKALTISQDNSLIAVGFGSRIHLFNYQGHYQNWRTILDVPDFATPAEVKFQVANFSSDNTTLAVATQRHDVYRSAEDDSISTYVWKCMEQAPPPQKMGPCKMPTDGQGLTTIHHSPALSMSLILGASPTPYPFFLFPLTTSFPPATITEYRIRCACLSPPPNCHIAYMMDFKNKIFKIDMRALSVVLMGDLNLERGALAVREEPAAMGVTAEGTLSVFWRQGSGLWVCVLGREGAGRKLEKSNLRGVWEDAGGGGD